MDFGRVVVALLFASCALAQTPDALDSKVRNLAHPRYAEREKAARELDAAGESALPALRAVADSTDGELRARAAAIAERIERMARSQRLLAAPKLAFKFDKVPLDEAIAEVAKQAQRHFMIDKTKIKDIKRPITLDSGELPYWEALSVFYQAAGIAEDISQVPVAKTESGRRLIVRGPVSLPPQNVLVCRLVDCATPMPASTANALRVRALPANHAQNKYDDIKGEVTFHVDVDTAPGVALREIVGIEIRKATAEDGRLLASAYPVPPFTGGIGSLDQMVMQQLVIASGDFPTEGTGGGAHPYAITLKTNGLRPTRITELHGVVVAKMMTPVEPILTVSQFLKSSGRETTADNMTIQIKEVKTSGDGRAIVQLRLITRTDESEDVLNLPVQVKGRVQQFIRINRGGRLQADLGKLPEFKLLDPTGQPLKGLTAQVRGMSFDGSVMTQDVEIAFEKPAQGAEQLSLALMAKRVAVVEMPFVLKNVPMP
jgi:hypothetical protein